MATDKKTAIRKYQNQKLMTVSTKQITTLKELSQWVWDVVNMLRKANYSLTMEDIRLMAHPGLERIMNTEPPNSTFLWLNTQDFKFYISGLPVDFHKDYDKKTCIIDVPNYRPGTRMVVLKDDTVSFRRNQDIEAFQVYITNLI